MDIELAALNLLTRVGCPLRLPTVCWLLSDAFDIIDFDARQCVTNLVESGKLKQTSGGWLEVK